MTDRLIQKSFEYFFRKVYKQEKFQFHFTPYNLKIYETLLKEIDKRVNTTSLGKQFVWRYCIFQFTYWDELIIDTPSSRVGFSHIFGKKAIDRYFTRDKEYDWQFDSPEISLKYKLSTLEFNSHVDPKKDKLEHTNSGIRLRFLNTDKGLATCLSQTTLFDRKDSSCLLCNFQTECKELLKTNYPTIYKNRYGR